MDIIYIPTSKALGLVWSHSSPDIEDTESSHAVPSENPCMTSKRALYVKKGFFTQDQYPQNQNVIIKSKEPPRGDVQLPSSLRTLF